MRQTTLTKHIAKLLISQGITVYVVDVSRAWVVNSPITHTVTVPHNGKDIEITPHQSTVLDLSLALAKYAYMRTNDGLSMLATITSE